MVTQGVGARALWWELVGWSLKAEGGDSENECDDAENKTDPVCRLEIKGLKSWADKVRESGR